MSIRVERGGGFSRSLERSCIRWLMGQHFKRRGTAISGSHRWRGAASRLFKKRREKPSRTLHNKNLDQSELLAMITLQGFREGKGKDH